MSPEEAPKKEAPMVTVDDAAIRWRAMELPVLMLRDVAKFTVVAVESDTMMLTPSIGTLAALLRKLTPALNLQLLMVCT